jgi:integrase/recombinase XerD
VPTATETPAPVVDARFEALLLDFLAYLEFERGLARNTLAAYRTDLLQYGTFLAERGESPTSAGIADVSDFLAELARGGEGRAPSSAATLNRKTACLRSFYRHLRRGELIETDPTANLSRRGRARHFRRSSTTPRSSGCSTRSRGRRRRSCATARSSR